MRTNNIAEPTPAELNEFIEAYQNATPEAQAEARAMLQAEADDVDEYRGFILQAFDHAADEMLNDETKAEALQLARLFVGNPDMPESSPMFSLMSGFIIGMSEGMRIADTLNAAAAEQAAQ